MKKLLLFLSLPIHAGCGTSKNVIVPLDEEHAIVINKVERKTLSIVRASAGSLRKKRIKRRAKVFVRNNSKVPKLDLRNVKR